MSLPDSQAVIDTLEATWPPADVIDLPPFRLRRGEGGGKRVSAASLHGPKPANITAAEDEMRRLGQTPTFRLTPGEEDFDATLEDRGYHVVDPTLLMAMPCSNFISTDAETGMTDAVASLWDTGGVGPERRAVMDRVEEPKAVLNYRKGAVFVALGGHGAMFHALHVDAAHRRQGIGRVLTKAAVGWAAQHQVPWISLAVVEANVAAIALYASLGFQPVGRYWYRTSRG